MSLSSHLSGPGSEGGGSYHSSRNTWNAIKLLNVGNTLDCRIINRKHQKTVPMGPPTPSHHSHLSLLSCLPSTFVPAPQLHSSSPLFKTPPSSLPPIPWSLIEWLCLPLLISIVMVMMQGVWCCHGNETDMAGMLNETGVSQANKVRRQEQGVFLPCDNGRLVKSLLKWLHRLVKQLSSHRGRVPTSATDEALMSCTEAKTLELLVSYSCSEKHRFTLVWPSSVKVDTNYYILLLLHIFIMYIIY